MYFFYVCYYTGNKTETCILFMYATILGMRLKHKFCLCMSVSREYGSYCLYMCVYPSVTLECLNFTVCKCVFTVYVYAFLVRKLTLSPVPIARQILTARSS